MGDTKVKIQIDDDLDDYSLIEEADNDEKVMEEIDQEVETDYLKE